MVKIEFLNNQANIYLFKFELYGFCGFTLRNIAIGQYHYTQKTNKNDFFLQNWGIAVLQNRQLTKKK